MRSLEAILAVAFGLAVAAVGFAFYIAHRNYVSHGESEARATVSREVLAELQEILVLSEAQRSASRGFVIARSDLMEQAQRDAAQRLPLQIEQLRPLLAGRSGALARLEELAKIIATQTEWHERVIAVARNEGRAPSVALVTSGRSDELMRSLRDTVAELAADENKNLEDHRRAADYSESRARFTALVLCLMVAMLLAGCYVLLRNQLAARRAAEAAQRELNATLDQRVRERTAQLQRAQRQEALLATIVESSADAIVSVGLDSRVVSWNRGAERLFGYTASEMMGHPVTIMIPPERVSEIQGIFAAVDRGEVLTPYETVRRHKSGALIPVLVMSSAVRDVDGRLIGRSAILRDMSARKQLENVVVRLSDYEQRRLGLDLHDGIGQQLTATELMLQVLARSMPADRGELRGLAERIGELINNSVTQVRQLARGLTPFFVESDGLQAALENLVHSARGDSACRLVCPRPIALPDKELAMQLYRIAQEAFNNAVRHSGATEIEVRLREEARLLRLEIVDNGKGLPAQPSANGGMGLQIMRYRAGLIGAMFDTVSQPGAGLTVACTLPLPD